LNITLDDEIRAFVEERSAERGCESAEAYIAGLVAADYRRWARERLEALLMEGIESGPAVEVTEEWRQSKFERLEAAVGAKVGTR
jgi:antitoxin ParD1/3/4